MRGGFQTIQGGVASGSERHVASLAAKGLDALGMAMCAIPDQGVDMRIGDPGVRALLVGTGEPSVFTRMACSPAAFHLTPGAYRRWSRSHSRRGGAGEATGRAIVRGAWLEKTLHRGAHSSYF